ncbi:NUDIX domain-containing protein [Patescibacteria group bacterium]|nr:MAG: NUDIX domain-containing protein [Patescibacteria group bacterium]
MKYSFCPKCGDKLKSVNHENKTRLQCSACGFIFYQNAKPTASVLIENDKGEILLTRRAIEPLKGYWDTAGGFCEEDEHPEDAARREIKEELGVDVELTGLVGIFMDYYGDGGDWTINIHYSGRIKGGDIKPADDIDGYEWFPLDSLPEVAFESGQSALDTLKKMRAK